MRADTIAHLVDLEHRVQSGEGGCVFALTQLSLYLLFDALDEGL